MSYFIYNDVLTERRHMFQLYLPKMTTEGQVRIKTTLIDIR